MYLTMAERNPRSRKLPYSTTAKDRVQRPYASSPSFRMRYGEISRPVNSPAATPAQFQSNPKMNRSLRLGPVEGSSTACMDAPTGAAPTRAADFGLRESNSGRVRRGDLAWPFDARGLIYKSET